jgi:hypothetical protein
MRHRRTKNEHEANLTKIMKKNNILGLVAGLCLATITAQADTITVAWGYPNAPATATIYDSANNIVDTFQTFCLEDSEYFAQGYHYDYNTGSTVVYGGPNGTGNPASAPLTVGTVDLFKAYQSGVLPVTDAGLVQQAIWYDQGYSAFGTAAVLALGGSYLDMSAYSGSQQVLNLYTPNNGDGLDNYGGNGIYQQRQSFLDVPDGGLTIAFLGGALLGLQTLRRKLS